ncbi:sporulation protein YqfD [Dehalobacter sp. DCM]|uniref:sporulation protein YqfD n=1 Tax=Dehalobacter sp. DCM TaxID=2907827 RepID=UPI003081CDFC|nr:sporulation protein YqfD [Dehalobacter sp. DCM]
MFGKFARYLHGRVYIKVQGNETTRFINEAIKENIKFYNGKKLSDGFTAEIETKDFKNLRKAAKAAGVRFSARAKYGFPFVALRWQRRKGLIAGFFIIAAGLIILSQFVLSISLEGNSRITDEQILAEAEKAGLKTWVLKSKLDMDSMSKQIQDNMTDLAWVTMEKRGTNIRIRVVEKTLPKKVIFQGDLIAAKTAYVEDVIVIQGNALVKEGDTVKAGQVLIKAAGGMTEYSFDVSGDSTVKKSNVDAPAAKGFVRGRVWYSAEKKVPLEEDQVVKTDKDADGWGIKLNNRVIMITNESSPYAEAVAETYTYTWHIWRNWRFPVELIKVHYDETKKVHIVRTESEAKKLAETLAREELKLKLPSDAKILNDAIRILPSDSGAARIRVEIETFEELAVYKQ